MKSYLQFYKKFHEEIMKKIRSRENNDLRAFSVPTPFSSNVFTDQQQTSTVSVIHFNNYVFNFENFNIWI